jgi:hypothetical protein
MLVVKTKIGPSKIDGIGLFAAQPIPKGTVVWKYDPGIDRLLSEEEVTRLAKPIQERFHNYAFFDTKYSKYMFCGDDGRFFNHSDTPNCDDGKEDITIALRDIREGEELTVDYRSFYGNIEDHKEIQKEMSSVSHVPDLAS